MKLHDALAAGIAHLSQNRLRTGLSILGILIGIASVLCMIAIGDGAKVIIAKDIETLGGVNQVQFLASCIIKRKWNPTLSERSNNYDNRLRRYRNEPH